MTNPAGHARARKVELILERLGELPTLSTVAQKVLSAGSTDEVDIGELSRLIEADPSLTGKVLSMCRRADRGLGDKITSVSRAITLLGLDAVISAVLSVEVFRLLSDAHGTSERGGFDAQGHWRHAIAVASAAELIATAHGSRDAKPETAFVGGLLHSIGRMALEIALPDAYSRVLRVAESRGVDAGPLERELIGIDHHAAGKYLAEHWGLPRELSDCAWLHAQPVISLPKTPHRGLIATVSTARALCRRLNMGWSGDFGPVPDVHAIAVAAELDPGLIDGLTVNLAEQVAQRSTTLGLDEVTGTELMLESVLRANARLADLNHSLQKRSSHGEQQRRVLNAIADFGASATGKGLSEVLASVGASARSILGGSVTAVVVQAGRQDPWQAVQSDEDGGILASAADEPPMITGRSGTPQRAPLTAIGGAAADGFKSIVLLPWVADQLGMVEDPATIHPVMLPMGDEGAAAVLLIDSDVAEGLPSETHRRAVLTSWGSAVNAALRLSETDALTVELADRHRELAEAQIKLAESRSMAHLGEMTAGAAHELNNPLTVIKGYGQVLRRKAKDSELREPAERIAEAAQQLSDLITSLHILADPPEPEPVVTGLVDILNESVQLARQRTRKSCSVRMIVPDSTPPAVTDPALLARALCELVSNAAESETSEIIEIRVQTDPLDDRLMVVVKDRGRGMPSETLAHAFDPFFSSRPAGRGTGLGLARAKRLVELMGGTIALASEEGEGTTATVTIAGWRGEADKPAGGGSLAA
ncbi:MAG: HDOD domain-containing protein [Planctomycetota bacterium]